MSEEDASSKKPVDNAFQQQKLKAWQPLLTPEWVIGTFLLVGLVFVPIGVVVLVESNKVVEISARYDQVATPDPNCGTSLPYHHNDCYVTVTIEITEDMDAPIYFYYKLTNFYQNHRRYVKSRSDKQLKGEAGSISSCDPLEEWNGQDIYPCGLIANSLFNDTFEVTYKDTVLADNDWNGKGISWKTDRDDKFDRRALEEGETGQGPGNFTIWTENNNEDFIVWMRTAGLPTFKKLYRKIEDTSFKKGDQLSVKILNVFPVEDFDGEKSIVLSTTSWLGGKNAFLGWAYIIVGSLCLLLAVVFLVKHKVSPRTLGDMKYFNWPGAKGRET